MAEINWDARLIGIKGARGVGKTTLLLQYILLNLSDELPNTLYASLDNLWFSNNSLDQLADTFVKRGGKFMFLDEVHKYPGWAQSLKNIYDDHPGLKIVFTGSSLLEILNARADLSRRAVVYHMQGFSFREFLSIETGISFNRLSLDQVLMNHLSEATLINQQIKPFRFFDQYLRLGYYPFYREQPDLFTMRLGEVINMMLDIELPLLRGVDVAYISKIRQLLVIIAGSVPFIPNISKLSERIGMNRTTLLSYFYYLEEIALTRNLFKDAGGISKLQKPSKVYLDNTNLIYTLAPEAANVGNIRETFFANQVGYSHQITYASQGDFIVDDKSLFEIGGKGKNSRQLPGIANEFVVADEIEYGHNNTIPLWLFGFLY
jgi:predicted AAA+ superfamily ATPase